MNSFKLIRSAIWSVFSCRVAKSYLTDNFCPAGFHFLHVPEQFVRNDGYMGILVQILLLLAFILHLYTAGADCFLQQNSTRIFFIGQQLVDGLPAPLSFSGRRGNLLFGQFSGNCPQAHAALILRKDAVDDFGLFRINNQFAVGVRLIPIAFVALAV